jgi:hypothetical protein
VPTSRLLSNGVAYRIEPVNRGSLIPLKAHASQSGLNEQARLNATSFSISTAGK